MTNARSRKITPPLALTQSADLRKDFVLPLAVIGTLLILVLTLGVHFAVRAFDQSSEIREQTLARNGISQRIAEVGMMVVPQADWDDAVRFLDNRYDAEWAASNIGKYLTTTNGFHRSFVLDAGDAPIFAARDGAVQSLTEYNPIRPLASRLIADVRKREAHRGRFTGGQSVNMISQPIQASALKLIDNSLTILTVSLVQPDFGTALPTHDRAPLVITTMKVDGPFLESFSKRFLLDNVNVRLPSKPLPRNMTEIPAQDENGRTLAYFTWTPLNPGYTLLRQMMPPILIGGLLLLAIGFIELRRIFRAARGLVEREAFARETAYHDPLTGLPNRESFEEHLDWELHNRSDSGTDVAVISIRMPEVWQITETIGIAGRDEALGIIAKRLSTLCRSDSLLARVAPDEFAVMAAVSHDLEAKRLAARLKSSLDAPLSTEAGPVECHFQIGAIVAPSETTAIDAMHAALMAAVKPSGDDAPEPAGDAA